MTGISRSPKDWHFLKQLFVLLLAVEAFVFVTAYFLADFSLEWTGTVMLVFLFATLYVGSSLFMKRPPAGFLWGWLGVTLVLEAALAFVCLSLFALSFQMFYVAACLLLLVLLVVGNWFTPGGGGDFDMGIDV